MRRNNWGAMPPEYYMHKISILGESLPDKPHSRRLFGGWVHKEYAYSVKHCGNPVVVGIHNKIRKTRSSVVCKGMLAYRRKFSVCEECGINKPVDTHHIISRSKGGEDAEHNYQALCLSCHAVKHPELPEVFFTPERRADTQKVVRQGGSMDSVVDFFVGGKLVETRTWRNIPRVGDKVAFNHGENKAVVRSVVWGEVDCDILVLRWCGKDITKKATRQHISINCQELLTNEV